MSSCFSEFEEFISESDSLYGNKGNDLLIDNAGRNKFFWGNRHDKVLDWLSIRHKIRWRWKILAIFSNISVTYFAKNLSILICRYKINNLNQWLTWFLLHSSYCMEVIIEWSSIFYLLNDSLH